MNPQDLELACIDARRFFEKLSPDDTRRMRTVYTEDAYFKDPFNEVTGADAIAKIFEHMFAQVQNPRFVVKETVAQANGALLTWDFLFESARMAKNGDPLQTVRGASHLKFAADGRINYHRDYWDVAEELYEKIPFLGALMRFLKRKAAN
jgi:steroid Delta-isomerase